VRRLLLLGVLGVGLPGAAYLVLAPDGVVPSWAVSSVASTLVDAGAPPWLADDDLVAFALNVALFLPPFFVAALLWRRVPWWTWAVLGLLVSGAIETTQALFLSQRTPQVADLVSNALGAALWALLASLARPRWLPRTLEAAPRLRQPPRTSW